VITGPITEVLIVAVTLAQTVVITFALAVVLTVNQTLVETKAITNCSFKPD